MLSRPGVVNFAVGMRDIPGAVGEIGDPQPSIGGLQRALRAVGAIASNERFTPGVFDKVTAAGVRRFQWYHGNVPGCLDRDGAYNARDLDFLVVDGRAGPSTFRALARFSSFGWQVTGDLVRVNLGGIANVSANSGFSALIYGDSSIVLCDRSFAPTLMAMGSQAVTLKIYVFINQVFRVEGAGVSGAVVTPAGFSAHKIGRAVDLQLGTKQAIGPGNPQLSAAIKNAPANSDFAKFREAMKESGCRYGGEFSPSDPPHFDRQVLPGGSPIWKSIFYFNQLQYTQALKNDQAIPMYDTSG